MKTVLQALQALSRAAEAMREGVPVEAGDGHWLAAGLEALRTGVEFEAAFGMPSNWRQIERLALRDDAIRAFAQARCAGEPAAVAHELNRYSRLSWHRDQVLDSMPAHYAGTPKDELFEIFHIAEGKVPTTTKQLRNILKEGNCPPPRHFPHDPASSESEPTRMRYETRRRTSKTA
jgi:hypothetical protein